MSTVGSTVAGSMPKLASVRPAGKLSIMVTWSEGPRAHLTETIDLSPLIHSVKFYKRLRKDHALFKTAHVIEDGEAVAWGNDDDNGHGRDQHRASG